MTDVMVPMRDGVRLHTRLYLPEGGPHPALLRRTPYPWEWMGVEEFNEPNCKVAENGYALAVQYVRGRFESEGDFEPFRHDVADGYDSIQWLAEQPWCSGAVGMYGLSYESSVQTAAVVSGHPALKCIVPQAFGTSFADGFPYYSPGIFSLGQAVAWAAQIVSEREAEALVGETATSGGGSSEDTVETGNEIYEMYRTAASAGWHEGLLDMTAAFRDQLLPVLDLRPGGELELMQKYAPWWRSWVQAETASHPYWAQISIADRDDLALPALHISGWFDQFAAATIERFARWSSRASTPEFRAAQRLIVGPWAHGLSGEQWHGHVRATPEAELFSHPDIERFHRRWLHQDEQSLADSAPIHLYVMGDNVWRAEQEWPLKRTVWTRLYLYSEGAANTEYGDGKLSMAAPVAASEGSASDSYWYDPADPVPAIGGAVVPALVLPGPGPFDQRSAEQRRDVLVYTAPACDTDLEVTGPVNADLWVSTSAVDTDFTAKLVDVFPDGAAIFICQGIVRPSVTALAGKELTPGATYHVRIDLAPTSYVFQAGHSIRLEVSSSCFPVYDPNPNTGGRYSGGTPAEHVVAEQHVFHEHDRPSHLTLPVIPRA